VIVRALLALALALGGGCVSAYEGTARPASPETPLAGAGWIRVADVPLVKQKQETDCGAAAIAMVVAYWTGAAPPGLVAAVGPATARGIKARRLRDFARDRGLAAYLLRGEVADLEHELRAGRPILVGLVKPQKKGVLTHYEVVVAYHPERRVVVTLDPAEGWRQNSLDGFLAEWKPAGHLTLVVSAR
jgi:ABC-type bacteriocin/lantibiotic exporter with double-glycine peptidase domain